MLLFEFFPAFIALVSVIVGVALYMAERRARAQGINDAIRGISPRLHAGTGRGKTTNRPSEHAGVESRRVATGHRVRG